MTAGDVVTAVLLPLGGLFTLVGTLGLVRLRTLLARMHAATKPDTVGLVLILAGVAPQLRGVGQALPLLLVVLFQFLTVPVLAQTLGRVAYSRGEASSEEMVVDELGEAMAAERDPAPGKTDE